MDAALEGKHPEKSNEPRRLFVVAYLDVDFNTEGLRLAVSVADVKAKDILGGLRTALAVLDVEDATRGHVLHRERRVGSDDPGTANRVSWWIKWRTQHQRTFFNNPLKFI